MLGRAPLGANTTGGPVLSPDGRLWRRFRVDSCSPAVPLDAVRAPPAAGAPMTPSKVRPNDSAAVSAGHCQARAAVWILTAVKSCYTSFHSPEIAIHLRRGLSPYI